MKSCGPFSLRTGSYLVGLYTLILAVLLIAFNAHDYVSAYDYYPWSRILGLVIAAALFLAGIALIIGIGKNSRGLLSVWLGIFSIYFLFQLVSVIWNIVNYSRGFNGYQMPVGVQNSILANFILFGILLFINALALAAVNSYRTQLLG